MRPTPARLCAWGALLLLAACATPKAATYVPAATETAGPPAVREVVVKVPAPVKTPCVPRNLPPAPRYPDTAKALREAGGAADRYQLLAAGRILRNRRLAMLERIVAACR